MNIALAAGCSGDAADGTVTGTVKLDGQPLKAGTMRFDAVDNRTASADASIVDGKYSATMLPGEKRVLITSPKVVGKKKMYDTPDSPVYDITEELIPRRYNGESDLKQTVTAGSQTRDFELQSK